MYLTASIAIKSGTRCWIFSPAFIILSSFSDKSVEGLIDTHSGLVLCLNEWNAIKFGHVVGLFHIHVACWQVTLITNEHHRYLEVLIMLYIIGTYFFDLMNALPPSMLCTGYVEWK